MTKAELFSNVSEAVTDFAEANGLSDEVQAGLSVILSDNLAPKSGGGSINLDEVTRTEDGVITELLCGTSKVWLPATEEFFYEDKAEDPKIVGSDGVGLKRLSRQAESIGKKFIKTTKATIDALTDDLIASEDANESAELKAQIVEAKAAKPDYSTVTA